MPCKCRSKTAYEKYISSSRIIRDILSNHGIETINDKRALYVKGKRTGNTDPELEEFYKIYMKYYRNQKVVDQFELNLPEGVLPPSQFDFCDNRQ
jgi:hypothetical protein